MATVGCEVTMAGFEMAMVGCVVVMVGCDLAMVWCEVAIVGCVLLVLLILLSICYNFETVLHEVLVQWCSRVRKLLLLPLLFLFVSGFLPLSSIAGVAVYFPSTHSSVCPSSSLNSTILMSLLHASFHDVFGLPLLLSPRVFPPLTLFSPCVPLPSSLYIRLPTILIVCLTRTP